VKSKKTNRGFDEIPRGHDEGEHGVSGEELGRSGERAKSFPKEGSLSPFLVLAVKKKGGRGGLVWLEGRDVDSIQIRLGPGRVHFRPTRADGPPQVADGPPLILSFSDALPTNPPDGPPNDLDGPPLVADGPLNSTDGPQYIGEYFRYTCGSDAGHGRLPTAHPVRPCLTRFFRGVAILRVEAWHVIENWKCIFADSGGAANEGGVAILRGRCARG